MLLLVPLGTWLYLGVWEVKSMSMHLQRYYFRNKNCFQYRKQVELGCDSLWSFPLEFYTKLKYFSMSKSENLESFSVSEGSHQDLTSLTFLRISECPNFVSFASGGLWASNFTQITIFHCKKLKSLPEGMHTLLPSLVFLDLNDCQELESFPKGGLPSNLVNSNTWNHQVL